MTLIFNHLAQLASSLHPILLSNSLILRQRFLKLKTLNPNSCFGIRRYTQLARPWYECSITRQCIAPDGSNRETHRQDQSALTILAALSGDSCEGVGFFLAKNTNSILNNHKIGVNDTQCYRDPLNFKWK